MSWDLLDTFNLCVESVQTDPDAFAQAAQPICRALPTYTVSEFSHVCIELSKVIKPRLDDADFCRRVAQVLAFIFANPAESLTLSAQATRVLAGLIGYLTVSIPAAEPTATYTAALVRATPELQRGCVTADGAPDPAALRLGMTIVNAFFRHGVRTTYFDTAARAALLYALGRVAHGLAAAPSPDQTSVRTVSAHLARTSAGEHNPACLLSFFSAASELYPLLSLEDDPLAPTLPAPPGRPAALAAADEIALAELVFDSFAAYFPLEYTPDPTAAAPVAAADLEATFETLWVGAGPQIRTLAVEFLVDVAEGAASDSERVAALGLLGRLVRTDQGGLGLVSPFISTIFWALSQDAVHLKNAAVTKACAAALTDMLSAPADRPESVPGASPSPSPVLEKFCGTVAEYVARDVEFDSGGDAFIADAVSALAVAAAGAGACAAHAVMRGVVPALIQAVGRRAIATPGETESGAAGQSRSVAAERLARVSMFAQLVDAAGPKLAPQSALALAPLTPALCDMLTQLINAQASARADSWVGSEEARRAHALSSAWFTHVVGRAGAAAAAAAVETASLVEALAADAAHGAVAAVHALAQICSVDAHAADALGDAPVFAPVKASASAEATAAFVAASVARPEFDARPGAALDAVLLPLETRAVRADAGLGAAARAVLDAALVQATESAGEDACAGLERLAQRLAVLLRTAEAGAAPCPASPLWARAAVVAELGPGVVSEALLPGGLAPSDLPTSSSVPKAAWNALVGAAAATTTADHAGHVSDLGCAAGVRIAASRGGPALQAAAAALTDVVLGTEGAPRAEVGETALFGLAIGEGDGRAAAAAALIASLAARVASCVGEAAVAALAGVLARPGAAVAAPDASLRAALPGLLLAVQRPRTPCLVWAALAAMVKARPEVLGRNFGRVVQQVCKSLEAESWADNDREASQDPDAFALPLLRLVEALASAPQALRRPYALRVTRLLGFVLRSHRRSVRDAARRARCSWLL